MIRCGRAGTVSVLTHITTTLASALSSPYAASA